MYQGIDPNMLEATRLTREGRLAEAMALIRRGLGAETGPAPAAPIADDIIDLVPETVTWSSSLRAKPAAPRPSADRPARSAPGQFVSRSFSNEAGSRAYKLYVPKSVHAAPMPLVVMLHGCTQSADDFAAGTRMNQLAEEMGFIVIYPEQSQTANSSRCWNWFEPAHQKRDAGEPSIIAGITRQVMRDQPVDASRVYIAGLSAGGAAAAVMGAAYPDLYAAVGVHSGLALGSASNLVSALSAMQGQGAQRRPRAPQSHAVPTIVFHGDADRTVHPANGDAVIAAVAAKGLKVSTDQGHAPSGQSYTRATGTAADGRVMVEQWTIHGAAHAWSGGSTAGSYTDPRGPDASREMLRFFIMHRFSGVSSSA
jgi:poly(hydroxyalkanoate) depolymerase family esterase